jgi:Tetracyclin repressor-like, C-terminal domain/Bacterial regulatory proteins, tetR family
MTLTETEATQAVPAEPAADAATVPQTGPARKRGTALEDAIRAAAYAELSEVGYTAFSVEGVAARARTGKASIYRRWPSKIELLLDALCCHLPTPQQCGLDMVIGDDITTADALRQVADSIAAVLNSPAGDAIRAIKCEAAADPALAKEIDARFQAPRRAALMALLQRGVDRGEVRPEAVSTIVADVLPAMLSFRVVIQRVPLTGRDVRAVVDEVLIPLVEPR